MIQYLCPPTDRRSSSDIIIFSDQIRRDLENMHDELENMSPEELYDKLRSYNSTNMRKQEILEEVLKRFKHNKVRNDV